MKITVLQSNLSRALSQVSRIVGSRTTLPVLSNVLLSAEKGKITFSATDLEVGITTSIIGKIDEEGKTTLPAKLLLDFVLNDKDESIEIKVDGTIAQLQSTRYKATIHGISADEFPTIPEASAKETYSLPKNDLVEALKKVNISAATDDTRPVLSGVYFAFNNKDLTLVATDSYRLSEKKMTISEAAVERSMIVPTRTMNELLRIATGEGTVSEVSLSASESQVSFKIGDTTIVSRLIEGSFPNYKSIIPNSFKTEISVGLSDLIGSVKMSSLFARGSANNNIKFEVSDGKTTISSAASEAGSASSSLESMVSGGDVDVSFNARYLLDILNVLAEERVILKLNDSSSAGVVTGEKEGDFTYIIMPLKVEN